MPCVDFLRIALGMYIAVWVDLGMNLQVFPTDSVSLISRLNSIAFKREKKISESRFELFW